MTGESRLPQVAFATCRELPHLDADTRRLIAPLAERGVIATSAVWDNPNVDWARFDLVVVRSCWDYARRRREFLEWAARVPRLANPGISAGVEYRQGLSERACPARYSGGTRLHGCGPGKGGHSPSAVSG